MLALQKLVRLKIKLRFTVPQRMAKEDYGGDQIRALREWFREAFEGCGKTVVVEIGYEAYN